MTVLGIAACSGDLPSILLAKSGRISYFARNEVASCVDLGARLADVERELSAVLPSDGGAITYYLFDDTNDLRRNGPCGADGPSRSCSSGNQVFSTTFLSQHELVHAFMSSSGSAPPLIEEGLAEAVKCGSSDITVGGVVPVSWREAAAASPRDSGLPYLAGRRIVQWTSDNFGWPAFMQYYRDSVSTLSPALVDLQYRRQFGVSLDQVWDETWIRDAVPHDLHVAPTCPCAGEDLLAVGFGVTRTTCTPLFRSFQAPAGQIVRLRSSPTVLGIADCAGHEPLITVGVASSATRDVLLQLSAVRHFLEVYPQASLEGIQVETGAWLTEDCAGVTPLVVDAASFPAMTWIVERANRWQYLTFENTGATAVLATVRESLTGVSGEWQVCDSCTSCDDIDLSAGVALAPGRTNLRVMADRNPPTTPPHVLYRVIEWDLAP